MLGVHPLRTTSVRLRLKDLCMTYCKGEQRGLCWWPRWCEERKNTGTMIHGSGSNRSLGLGSSPDVLSLLTSNDVAAFTFSGVSAL